MAELKIPVLTRELMACARVIAKGRAIRDLARLVQTYGGKPSLWVKKSSPVIHLEKENYEIHWYEQAGIGRFEMKLKKVDDL